MRAFEALAGLAGAAERAGFDSFWVEDPLTSGPGANGAAPYDPYALLGSLSVRTSSIELGVVPGGEEVRPPAILAKIISGVDVVSNGRALLAARSTQSSQGDTPAGGGVVRLRERIEVWRAVLEGGPSHFSGSEFHVDGAVNLPAPVQPEGIPIVLFANDPGSDRAEVLRIGAVLADVIVVRGAAGELASASAAVEEETERAGRAVDAVELHSLVTCPTDVPALELMRELVLRHSAGPRLLARSGRHTRRSDRRRTRGSRP